jgi:hypothetical protein
MNDKSGPLAHLPGRGGITVDEAGHEAHLGFWEFSADASPASWVGRLRPVFGEVARIAQVRHEQNRAVLTAKAANKPPLIPEPAVRQKLAREQQRKLAQLHHEVGKAADEIFLARAKLSPFDYGSDIAPALRRQELRSLLRGMDDKQRRAAMLNVEFRKAALEMPGLASNMPDSTLAELRQEQINARFPQEIAGLDEATQAVEVTRLALKTAERAVSAELIQSGTTVAEPSAPSEVKPWA